MKHFLNLLTVVLLAAVGCLLYSKYFELPPPAEEKPEPHVAWISAIDRQIAELHSPLPLDRRGVLPYVAGQEALAHVRNEVAQYYGGSSARNVAARQATARLCDHLLAVMNERNTFLRRVNDARTNTPVSGLVYGGPRADFMARHDEQAARINWWVTNISRQWESRRPQLSSQTDSYYAPFSSALQEPPDG